MQQLAALPSLGWALALVPLGFLAWRRPVWLVAVAFVAGVTWAGYRAGLILEQSLPAALEGRDLVIEGHIADIPSATAFGWRFPFDVTHARHAGETVRVPARILLSAGIGDCSAAVPETALPYRDVPMSRAGRSPKRPGVALPPASLPSPDAALPPASMQSSRRCAISSIPGAEAGFVPRAGEAWRLTARLKRPHSLQNPGGFDYEAHLFRNRLRATGYVRLDDTPRRLDEPTPARYAIDRVRQRLGEAMHARLGDNPFAGIVVALANGDGGGLADAQWDIFRRTGTLHLVAISGLHISLIGGIGFFLGRWLWALPGYTVLRYPAPVVGAVCALLAAAGYAALAGFVIPTQRALVMLGVVMGGILLRRQTAPSQLLAIALLAVLAYDPLAVMAAGFWLSFAAVAVILFVAHGGSGRMQGWRRWGYLQIAIALGMLPLMFALFQQVSLIAPLANLLAVPVFDLLMVPLVLAGLAFLGFLPAVAQTLFELAAGLLALLWPVLEWLGSLAWSQWTRPALPGWALVCAGVGVAWLLAPRGWPARWVGAVWLLPLALLRPPAPGPGEVWFTLLDVGQGLAATVRTASHTLVFDAGPRLGAFDAGRSVVAPYLRAQGVERVDVLVVSHGDNDHIGGVESVRRALPVEKFMSSVPERVAGAVACEAGQHWHWDGVEFRILNPPPEGTGKRNDQSCVLHVRAPNGSLLLPADIEAKAERRLVAAQGERLHADVLVAPHHGSKTSSTEAFLDAVRPQVVLLPVGYRNRFRHPYPAVVARYAAAGARRLDSASAGAIELRLRAPGMSVSAWRARQRRYWHLRVED